MFQWPSEFLSSTEIWDGGSFSEGPEMPIATGSHCQVTLNSKHIFVSDARFSRSTYLLNWEEQEWIQLDPAPERGIVDIGPCGLVTTEDRGREVVITAGGDTIVFSVETLKWRTGE